MMDKIGSILFHRNMDNNFSEFKNYMEPYLPAVSVGVESGCYYDWLADNCIKENIDSYLGHAFYMKAVNGVKSKMTESILKKSLICCGQIYFLYVDRFCQTSKYN